MNEFEKGRPTTILLHDSKTCFMVMDWDYYHMTKEPVISMWGRTLKELLEFFAVDYRGFIKSNGKTKYFEDADFDLEIQYNMPYDGPEGMVKEITIIGRETGFIDFAVDVELTSGVEGERKTSTWTDLITYSGNYTIIWATGKED